MTEADVRRIVREEIERARSPRFAFTFRIPAASDGGVRKSPLLPPPPPPPPYGGRWKR